MNSYKRVVRKKIPKAVLTAKWRAQDKKFLKTALDNDRDFIAVDIGERIVAARVVNDFSYTQQSAYNLSAIVDILERNKIQYFIVPGLSKFRYRVGISNTYRKKSIKILAKEFENKLFYAVKSPGRKINKGRIIPVNRALENMASQDSVIRIFEYSASESKIIFGSEKFGCDIEFWSTGTEISKMEQPEKYLFSLGISIFDGAEIENDALIAPRRNAVASLMPKEAQEPDKIEILGRKYSTFTSFTHTLLGDCDFPIDIVYTWVDGNDPKLAEKRAKYLKGINGNNRNNTISRYISRDELKYSLRSLRMYGPKQIRNIYIVTDGQKPVWLKDTAHGVKVVDHKDIFKDKKALPVFNPHAIESQIHHIKGLSDHYIYFNDDVFLGRPVVFDKFFTPSGLAKIMPSRAQYGVGKPTPNESAPSSAGKNVRALLEKTHDRFITNKFVHAPLPQLKKVSIKIEKEYEDAVNTTMRSRFRDPSDISFASALHNNYALITGAAITTKNRAAVVDIARDESIARMRNISRKRNYDFICLNDTNTPPEKLDEADRLVRDFLEDYFPFAAPWEKRPEGGEN